MEQKYAIGGTSVDCTRVTHHLYPQLAWLLPGINNSGNLGAISLVAAAREATLLRILAIAISHYKARDTSIDWKVAAPCIAHVLVVLME